MEWHELSSSRARVTITDLNPQPAPPPPVPGLQQKLSMQPSAIVRAIFQEMSGAPRQIPTAAEEVLIKRGRGIGMPNTFILPHIGETGVADGKVIEILNLTHGAHRLISPQTFAAAALKDYDAKKSASVESTISNDVRGGFIDGKWRKDRTGEVAELRAQFDRQYDADHARELSSIQNLLGQIGSIDGEKSEILLDGLGANVKLRVVGESWIVLSLFKTEIR
jgi:hypothetical protein